MYDVVIIGGGPAGATLARLVGRHLKVLLVEKRELPGSGIGKGDKCCGGLLAPDAQRMLSEMGLGLPKPVLEGTQLFVVKAVDLKTGRTRFYQRHYINMNRRRFDRWLLSLLPPQVEVRTGWRFKNFTRTGDGVDLVLVNNGKRVVEKARCLVGADGAASLVRRQVADGRDSCPRYFAVQEWLETDAPAPYFTSFFHPDITDFYGWMIPKGGHTVLGVALNPGGDYLERYARFKQHIEAMGIALGEKRHREGTFMLRPRRGGHLLLGDDTVLLAGEAAGWISPSSAEGFSYAFRSACSLADALLAAPPSVSRAYAQSTGRLRRNILVKSLKSALIFNPLSRNLIMNSGIRSLSLRSSQ